MTTTALDLTDVRLLLAAEQAVDVGAAILRRGRAHIGALVAKGDRDFATDVDLEIEIAMRAALAELAPAIPFLGEERTRWQYPFGAIHRTGGRLVAGSDWPVSTPDPLAAIHTAVTRTAYGDSGRAGTEPFLPEQALDLETAFAAYTSGSAWANHRDLHDGAGVLAPGAVADLVVLDRDPFAGPPEEIGAARVVSTWIDGAVVHG